MADKINELKADLWNKVISLFHYDYFQKEEDVIEYYENCLKQFSDSMIQKKYIEEYYINYLNYYPDPDVMFELGRYYHFYEKTSDMLKYYHLASELNHPIACFYLGEYYSKQNDEENMLKYYLKSAELQYNPALNNLGLYFSKEKEYEKAIQCFLKMDDDVGMFNLGILYEKKGYIDYALSYYGLSSASFNKEALNKMGCLTNDISYFMNNVLIHDDENAMIHLANHFEIKEEYNHMIYYLELASEKKNKKAIVMLSNYYQKKKENENKYIEMAADLEDEQSILFLAKEKKRKYVQIAYEKYDDEESLFYLAENYIEEKNVDKKNINIIEKAADKNNVKSVMFMFHYYVEKYNEVNEHLNKKLLKLCETIIQNPLFEKKDKYDAYLMKGQHAFNMNKLDLMIENYENAIKLDIDFRVYLKLGRYYFLIEDHDKSIKYLKEVLKRDKKNIDAYILIASIFNYKSINEDNELIDTPNQKKVIYYLNKALENGAEKMASYFLGGFYFSLYEFHKMNNYLEKALTYFNIALNNNLKESCFYIASCYEYLNDSKSCDKYTELGLEYYIEKYKKDVKRGYTIDASIYGFHYFIPNTIEGDFTNKIYGIKYENRFTNNALTLIMKNDKTKAKYYLEHGCNNNDVNSLKELHKLYQEEYEENTKNVVILK